MDPLGLQKAIEKAEQTFTALIPLLTTAVNSLVKSADKHIDEDLTSLFKETNQTLGTLMGDIYQLKKELIDDAHGVLDRLNGTTITTTFKVPPRS
jgi:hypothetical protein